MRFRGKSLILNNRQYQCNRQYPCSILTLLRVTRTLATNGHLLLLSGGEMGAGHVPERCYAVLDSTFGSMNLGDPVC